MKAKSGAGGTLPDFRNNNNLKRIATATIKTMEANVTQELSQVKTTAPLKNVALCMKALERAMNSPEHLPRIVSFSGPSGYGKSMAASYAANKYKAYYVECKSSWTKRALLEAIMFQMRIPATGPIYKLTEQISEQLVLSGRPLIIDEMDHIVQRSAVEIIRDIYEGSKAPILLIGEELMPKRLEKWERFHGRVLDWLMPSLMTYMTQGFWHHFIAGKSRSG